jgi:tRNA(Ile)-lysidine synthase
MTAAAGSRLVDELLPRCTFPPAGTPVDCAFSGGADSTALLVLAVAAGCEVTAIHVDHGLRPTSGDEAQRAAELAARIGVEFDLRQVEIDAGPNLEARARDARAAALPAGALTGHTADDQAETVVINLLRGAGTTGLAGMRPSPNKPLLAVRRAETAAVCAAEGLRPVTDPSNRDPAFVRNRVRHEVLPLLNDVARRDVVPLLARMASVLGDDDRLLDGLASRIDRTDAKAVATAEPALARRVLRNWIADGGHPPDLATVERALEVARGAATACELGGGRRLRRGRQRLEIVPQQQASEGAGQ